MKKSKLVRIEWRDPRDDWPWFHLLGMCGEWLKLRGADYPDGSAKHDGDCFWVHRLEVLRMHAEMPRGEEEEEQVMSENFCVVERDLNRYLDDEDAAMRLHERVLVEMGEILRGEPILSEMMDSMQAHQCSMLEDLVYQLAEVRIKTRDAGAESTAGLGG